MPASAVSGYMKLTDIYIYPIKSMGGIRLEAANLLREGLEHDRRWMLVDSSGNFLTQRQVPELVLIQGRMGATGILLSHKNGQYGEVELPFEDMPDSPPFPVKVWNDEVAASTLGGPVAEWLCDVLKIKCELVRIEKNAMRYSLKGQGGKYVSFADKHPFLIAGEASLAELNRRMEAPVPMSRFRPNLVFSGGKAFIEDTWQEFSIGQARFKSMGLCARCKVTLVDPESGRSSGAEPLRTLDAFRKMGNEVFFGVWAMRQGADEGLCIRIGDEVVGARGIA
jgi:uncharacterized protein YcbX